MSTLYTYSSFQNRIAAVSTETAQIIAVSPETQHFGTGYPTVGPDGRIYVFGDQISAVGEWIAWQSIDPGLIGPWVPGPPVAGDLRFTSLISLAGAFTRYGLALPATTDGSHDFLTNCLLLFPSQYSGAYTIVAQWQPDPDDENSAEGGFSDGTNFFYTTEGKMIWRVNVVTGVADFAVDLNDAYPGDDFDLSAGAYDAQTDRFLAFGFSPGPSAPYDAAIYAKAPGSVGPFGDPLISWTTGDPLLPSGFSGAGGILDRWYYFSGGYIGPIGRVNIDTYEPELDWFSDPVFTGVVTPYFASIGTPPLRQWQRSDTANRTGQVTTNQNSLRQGVGNSYL